MASRLRSSSGCLMCRRRRKKCDEIKPKCGHCVRLGLLCSWRTLLHSNELVADDLSLPLATPEDSSPGLNASERLEQLLSTDYAEIYKENPIIAVISMTYPPRSLVTRESGSSAIAQAREALSFKLADPYALPINFSRAHTSDTTAQVMLSFRDTARAQITAGGSVGDILSMDGLDLTLFFRQRQPEDSHTVSSWACEFTKAWPLLNTVTKLAFVHFVGTYMRWYIMPCAKTYALMSTLMRPLQGQLAVPHSAQIDLCHFAIIRTAQLEGAENWLDILTPTTQHFNWSQGVSRAVEEVASTDGSRLVLRLTEFFTNFCDSLDNWTLHESVVRHYIGIRGGIHREGGDPSSRTSP